MKEPLKELDVIDYRNKMQWRRFTKYFDSGKEVETRYFHKLKSNHYDIAFCIDRLQDCMMFNVSIPKYYYGTNIIQWIPIFSNPSFKIYSNHPLNNMIKETYWPLMDFFKRFFGRWFTDFRLDPRNVQITRLDFCFNQVYASKAEAFQVLHHMKRIRRKFFRDESKGQHDRHGGFSYWTQAYSCKVYHKGLEYKSGEGDRRRHKAFNRRNNQNYFPIESLQAFADRILRFEMTFRNAKMSEIYKEKVFRFDDELHQKWWSRRKSLDSNGYIKFASRGKEVKVEYQNLKGNHKRLVNYMRNISSKTFRFHLKSDSHFPISIDQDLDYIFSAKKMRDFPFERNQVLSKDLFVELGNYFVDFVREFQPKSSKAIIDGFVKIEEMKADKQTKDAEFKKYVGTLNRYIGNKDSINYHKLALILKLSAIYSYDEIKKMDLFPARTWYRYQQMLKRIGITKASFID